MHAASTTLGPKRRALALGALTTALFAALLGLAADRAAAAYSAHVENGVLKVVGDSASDRLTLQLAPGSPGVLEIDVGSTAPPTSASTGAPSPRSRLRAARATTRSASATSAARSPTRRSR